MSQMASGNTLLANIAIRREALRSVLSRLVDAHGGSRALARAIIEGSAASGGQDVPSEDTLRKRLDRLVSASTINIDEDEVRIWTAALGWSPLEHDRLVDTLVVNPSGSGKRGSATVADQAPALPANEFRGAPGTPTGPPVGYRRIPMVTIEPAAGSEGNELDMEIEEVEGETYLPDWYIRSEYGVDPERVRHIRVRGDSMRETILPGQRLTIALVQAGHVIADGHVYIFRGPGGVLIKRLYVEPDHIHVWSDNKKAPRYRVPLEVFSKDYRIAAVALEISSKL